MEIKHLQLIRERLSYKSVKVCVLVCWELDNCLTTQCFPDKLTLKSLTHDRILNRYICLSRCPDLDYNTLRFLEQKIQQIVQSVL